MRRLLTLYRPHLLTWLILCVAGGVWLVQSELKQMREAFETDARISHRLLSQRTVQHEAILATLALLQPPVAANAALPDQPGPAVQRLASVYPQVLQIQQRVAGQAWPDAGLAQAEEASRKSGTAALANVAFGASKAQYQLVLAAHPASYALLLDLHATVPWSEWSMPVATSPVRVTLEHAGQAFVVQAGADTGHARVPLGWEFEFHKHLASVSQPFDVVVRQRVQWHEIPLTPLVLWMLAAAGAVLAWAGWQRQREARHRAEELLRVGQVARLNALGELAAGMAHELNQPLTAVLANTQAAKRLLQDDAPDLETVQGALQQAAAQARRAADVLGRMRSLVEQPGAAQPLQSIALDAAVRAALELLQPECRARGVHAELHAPNPAAVWVDRVALEQIIHNLLTNALQALDQVAPDERQLTLSIEVQAPRAVLRVADSGPGIAADALPHIFEPFYSTREGGLGLGLSLCETLATGMGGQLRAEPRAPRGAVFILTLPLASDSP